MDLVPGPLLMAQSAGSQARAQFTLQVPNQPLWVGLPIALQGAYLATSAPGFPLELSNALKAQFAL